jgi:hypothetical protein
MTPNIYMLMHAMLKFNPRYTPLIYGAMGRYLP